MARLEFDGIDDLVKEINSMQAHTDEFCGVALYNGAKVVADSVKQAIIELPIDNTVYVKNGMKYGPSRDQKTGLINGFGITKMRKDDGVYNVKLGFDGFNTIKTNAWPNGQPNSLIARAVEGGTSFLRPNKFFAKAINRSKKECEQKMQSSLENYMNNLADRFGG